MELSAASVNNQLFLWRQNVTMTDSHKYITVSLLYVCRRNPSSNIHFVLWVNVYLFKCNIQIKFKWLNIAEKRTFVFIYCVLCNIKSLIINLNLPFNPIQMNFYHKIIVCKRPANAKWKFYWMVISTSFFYFSTKQHYGMQSSQVQIVLYTSFKL